MSLSATSPPRLISDELWALAEPPISLNRRRCTAAPASPRVWDRDVSKGIAFMLSTGIRLRQPASGTRPRLGQEPQTAYARVGRLAPSSSCTGPYSTGSGERGLLDWSQASLDSVSV
jgi:hypothetical protein